MKKGLVILALVGVIVIVSAVTGYILLNDSKAVKADQNTDTSVISSIWAVNDGEKVDRDDLSNPNKLSNSAWDGEKIKIFGGRNEIIAFQLIIESGSKGIKSLSVSLPKLSLRNGSSVIEYKPPEEDPTQYVGRHIQIFTENYMNVEKLTRASWIIPQNGKSVPENALGWKPAQLVPENAKPGRGGLPMKVNAKSNQGIWIEVYTPKDLEAGFYDGVITVSADGVERQIPVELELFDFTLPDENSMNAMFYYEGSQTQMYHGRYMDEQYHRFSHRNRAEFVTAYDIESLKLNSGLFTGKSFTSKEGYEGPGEGIGNRIIPRTFYGPGKLFDEKESAWKHSDEWMNFLNENYPEAITFIYMPDEPNESQYKYIEQLSDNIHGNPGPGKDLPIFVTKMYDKYLDAFKGAIDIWCAPAFQYWDLWAENERAHGDDMWVYNGGRPNAGAIIYETPATDPRANIWGCYKNNIKVYFYWHSNHWFHNHQMMKGLKRYQNVWLNPVTFISGKDSFANGDGVLVYPGEDTVYTDQDRGIKGPCSSIQMANFRRGLQDHLYLTMAKEKGFKELVDEVLNKVVPEIFSSPYGGGVGFAQTGNEYEEARYKLAKALAGKN